MAKPIPLTPMAAAGLSSNRASGIMAALNCEIDDLQQVIEG
jgi:hypothetical protein